MSWSADVFHVGPQKTGTTWVYRCFREHPDIATPEADSIHYYDLFYQKGNDWYRNQFPSAASAKIAFDPTYTYLRSPLVPERIAHDKPDAKIIICAREPVERAFSHYWHEKKKNRFNFRFEEVFDNFDLFTNWVEPGFYATHIERFLRSFPREQLKVVLFDDLEEDPAAFIKDLFAFAGVDSDFVPSIVDRKVNVAGPRQSSATTGLGKLVDKSIVRARKLWPQAPGPGGDEATRFETLQDVKPEVIQELSALFEEEIQKLEDMLKVDLSRWRNRYQAK